MTHCVMGLVLDFSGFGLGLQPPFEPLDEHLDEPFDVLGLFLTLLLLFWAFCALPPFFFPPFLAATLALERSFRPSPTSWNRGLLPSNGAATESFFREWTCRAPFF